MLKAWEDADYLVEVAQRHPEILLSSETPVPGQWMSIHQHLLQLYVKESQHSPSCTKLKSTSQLLAKLIARDGLNVLIVNLYPGNEGFSLMLRSRGNEEVETIRLSYEECDLLEHIDAEELPPMLVDLLDKAQVNIFYSGCVIVELRDYRRSTTTDYDTRFVLLHPTSHTLLCDINNLTNDGHRWTQEDKFQLESQLLLHTTDPLCLDPTPSVFYASSLLTNSKHTFNTRSITRHIKKYSQVGFNRRYKMTQCAAPKHLALHDFILRKKSRHKARQGVNLKVAKSAVDVWKQNNVHLEVPEEVDVTKYAKAIDRPSDKLIGSNIPVTVEELIMEHVEGETQQGKVLFTKLSIQHRMSDDFYLGELYTDRDYVSGQQKGSRCKFPLGTRGNVDKYIKQFTEIFTEEGRRKVKITHAMLGQKPTVTYTHTLPLASSASTAGQTTVTNTQPQSVTSITASLAGQLTDPKKGQPFKLAVQINPAQPANSQTTPSPGGVQHVTLTLQQQRNRTVPLQLGVQKQAASTNAATGKMSIANIQGINVIPGMQNVQVPLTGGATGSITLPLNMLSPSTAGTSSSGILVSGSTPTSTQAGVLTSPTLVSVVTSVSSSNSGSSTPVSAHGAAVQKSGVSLQSVQVAQLQQYQQRQQLQLQQMKAPKSKKKKVPTATLR